MKNFLLLLFFCSLSLFSKSQVVTGVYKGKMVSDSLKYSVDFELTLKEKNGELYGYCQRLFLIDDVLYYNLVKVKARIKDGVLIVEDEKSVSNNFEQKTKGIKTVYMFNIKDIVDTAAVLYGDWSTSSWRNLYAMPGKLVVNRERNYLATQLYKRLEEKKLSKEMLFDEPKPVLVSTSTNPQPTDVVTNQPNNKPPVNTNTQSKPLVTPEKDTTTTAVVVGKPQEVKPKPNDVAVIQSTTDKPTTTPVQNKPVVLKPADTTNKTSVAANNPQQSTTKPSDVAVNQPNNKPPVSTPPQNQPIVTNNKPTTTQQQNKPVVLKPADTTNKTSVVVTNPQQTKPQQTTIASNQATNKPPVTNPTQNQPTATTNKPSTTTNNPVVTTTQQNKPNTTGTNPQQNTTAANNKPVEQKPTTPVVTAPVTTTQQTQPSISSIGNVTTTNAAGQPQAGTNKPPVINNPVIVKRQVEIIEALEVTEDSVVLSLYDNGEIDGDTVSVFLNNELIVSRIGIKASAYKKTIAVPKGEIIQLTLFAENLGSIPPNTGLLIVTTTNERYQVNFSSTLNKSSSIVLKRKE